MSAAELKSPTEAEKEIASLFQDEIAENGGQFTVLVRDESAFSENDWLQLGTVGFASPVQQPGQPADQAELADLIKLGAFEWRTPTMENAKRELIKLLNLNEINAPPALDGVLSDISSIAVRIGLNHPIFDPDALVEMPYSRSTTVVSDTSGVLQGGLDFIVRFLHPAARVKIPAIVHMELVNAADRFFILRRKGNKNSNNRRRELTEHLKSQGGQRALLRLELQADTEIERTFLLGDPLREAFNTDTSNDVSGLNLSLPVKSYADRLILEAARHHQAQSGPAHKVRLLTSDQGLARMALAEGVTPLYFSATKAANFFDTRLTGRTFHPFTGMVQGTSLATVLWELASAFGSAKLVGIASESTFTVSALGREMSWSPYHSHDDLLWCASAKFVYESPAVGGGEEPMTVAEPLPREATVAKNRGEISAPRATFLRFDAERLIHLVCALDDNQELNVGQVIEVLGIKNSRGCGEYRRFLLSANLVSIEGQVWAAGTGLGMLSAALRNQRTEEIHEFLLAAPSYAAFAAGIEELKIGQPLKGSFLGRGTSTYRTLGEVTLICANVQNKGLYPTPAAPSADEFSFLALRRYAELEKGDGLVATGAWLESLISNDGIHPEIAKYRLDEASESRFLRRSTEGSTMQTRHDNHILHVLRSEAQIPSIRRVHLYRGDYLIPGKASVSLRIEGVSQ